VTKAFSNSVNLFLDPWIEKNTDVFKDETKEINFNKVNAFKTEFIDLLLKKDFDKLDALLNNLGQDTKELTQYINEFKLVINSYKKETEKTVVNDMLVNVLSLDIDADMVKKINKPISYKECIETSRYLFNLTKKKHFVFLISNKDTISGKITGRIRNNKIKVDLANHYVPKREDSEDFTLFFGEGSSKAKCAHTFSADFYSYNFEDGSKQYLVLALEPIESQRVILHGSICQVSDKMVVGESFQLPANLNVIFVNNVEEEKRDFTEKEIRELVGTPSFDDLKKMNFGVYEHPLWLEKLLFAWEFSYPIDGYPLHLGIIGPPGSGKTASIIDPILKVIPDENQRGLSTFKGYIPSFGSSGANGFNEGALLRADRICYLDEFLTPICAGSNNYNEISNLFGKMTSILEWRAGSISSGRGRNVNASQPTMQLLSCSNFQSGVNDIVQIASRLNNATLSRILWYVQNQENLDYTKSRVSNVMGIPEKERLPKGDGKIQALYDFFKMQDNYSEIDFNWVTRVHKKYEVIVPDKMKDVYIRYNHHLACIVDGISKLRWLIGEKDSFRIVDKQDYKEAEEIFSICVSSWNMTDEDMKKIPKHARVKHLNSKERKLYDVISNYPAITQDELNERFGNWLPIHEKLSALELIYFFDNKYYAFWHNYVQEKQLEVGEVGQNNISKWDN
jgi:hypothetical protein